MKTLLIFDGSFRPDCFSSSGEGIIFLFPLSSNAKTVDALKLGVSSAQLRLLNTAGLINASAMGIRSGFIGFTGGLSSEIGRGNTLWWYSLIAEKNTFKSDTFNLLAQFNAIVKVIREEKITRILFGCRNLKLYRTLSLYAGALGLELERFCQAEDGGIVRRISKAQSCLLIKHFLLLTVFAAKEFIRISKVTSKLGRSPAISQEKTFAIAAYYPYFDAEAASKGVFKHTDCASLQGALEKQAVTWILINGYNSAMNFDESLEYAKLFKQNGYKILFPEQALNLWDQISAFFMILLSGLRFLMDESKIAGRHVINGYNFYPIVREDWYASFTGRVGYEGILYHKAFKKLLAAIKPDRLLYFCEMHAWEKALIKARDAESKDTKLFGYQFGMVSPMLLNYFNDVSETARTSPFAMPGPDKILCNGRNSYERMKESGWENSCLEVVEAVRYDYLKKYLSGSYDKKRAVLIALSINTQESASILGTALETFRGARDIEIWYRAHPGLLIDRVLQSLGFAVGNFPFAVKNGPLEEVLAQARVVVGGETGVTVEALAYGCNVVLVDCPEFINMSPLRDIKSGMIEIAGSPAELGTAVSSIMNREYQAWDLSEAQKIVKDFFCFSPDSGIPEKFISVLKK